MTTPAPKPADLKTLVSPLGEWETPVTCPGSNGTLTFDNLPNELLLHTCDHIELADAKRSTSLTPCLSFSLLLFGQVEFRVGERLYCFSASESQPLLFASIVADTERFTRYLKEQQRVMKLNVTATKAWLLRRCRSSEARQKVESLFSTSRVIQLPLTLSLVELAEKILNSKRDDKLDEVLESELDAAHLFHSCFRQLTHTFDGPIETNNEPPKRVAKCGKKLGICHQSVHLVTCPIKDYIDSQICRIMNISILTKQLGASPATLQRHFRQRHGLSINQYIQTCRLERAKRQLLEQRLSIGEIAYEAGYSHVSNFSHAFKKRFALSPARFVKQSVEEPVGHHVEFTNESRLA